MRRFTLTPQSKKNIKTPASATKPNSFPRMSISIEDAKQIRNVRDKNYKQACCDNIMAFLTKNKYEGLLNNKILINPSNKDFQSIFKFIFSFIDYTPFVKFEEDVISILKIIKYPYSSEITRSQLSAITPHAWPVLLSMMSWLVDLINENYGKNKTTITVETEFMDFLYTGYERFMEGNEDDRDIEEEFINKINEMHSQKYLENENIKKEIDLLNNELEMMKNQFIDIKILEEKKKKVNDDINTLILHERQLENKKNKYISVIESLNDEIRKVEDNIENHIIKKNKICDQINNQEVKLEDIQGMSKEKNVLLKELEKIKPEKEFIVNKSKEIENLIVEKTEYLENLIFEIKRCRADVFKANETIMIEEIEYSIIGELENELLNKNKGLVSYEINIDMLNQAINDKEGLYKELEEQWNQKNTKLQTIGVIYLEKKEMSDRAQQKSINEVEKIDNDLLKLKLANDNALLKSERDYSETKIQFDILNANISRVKEEIYKSNWDFYNNVEIIIKSLNIVDKDVKKILQIKKKNLN